ncbi:GNAT family N-acetyltransferase [Amycolatopsis magusensis]|uniref:RimJ/RimL family protein N-acetyltransferase n=1 Tax=Amycolatopsis magusensis TaxID=882444 RepID=A0ABS4PRM0_9PSEU|nr:GNAT family N-acetyltransferase [Amycolatopsis magusensis]MBP2182055.1 RimJ/RimL family protein N-acetyltransferase [Amycolatopsis magusensis]MDI5977188.1 GNAT family N-acetyltransferase [Amycolatopsis magusensis]
MDEAGTYLETERLTLRRITESDAPLLVELDSDPEVMRYLTGGVPTSLDRVKTHFLPRMLEHPKRNPGYGFFIAHEKATGEFLGWFHLRPDLDAPADVPELGYRLRRAAWGKGYATEGSRALIEKAFTELGAKRVFAGTMAVNQGSRRVMEKAGLRYVRTFFGDWPEQIEGSEHGDVEYALDRSEWRK